MFLIKLMCIIFLTTPILAKYPGFVTVQKKEGISLRDSHIQKDSKVIGSVHYQYKYSVVKGTLSYVKIQLPNNKKGWVYVGGKEIVSIDNKRLKPTVDYPIPVKNEKNRTETIGYISSKDEVMILDYWYGRLKLLVPGGKEGWVFNGSYDDPWTTPHYNEFKDYYFAEFSQKNILSNIDVNITRGTFEPDQSAHKLFFPEESAINMTFSLGNISDNVVLELEHLASNSNKNSFFSPISIYINNQLFIKNYIPGGRLFKTDRFNIERFLESGENKIDIVLDKAKTHYLIKSLAVRY